MKNTIAIILLTAVLVAGGMFALEHRSASQAPVKDPSLGEIGLNRFTVAPTNTSVLCGQTSTLVIATSTSRGYLAIVNDASSTPIYLAIGRPAVLNKGIRLSAAGGSYEMLPSDNLFTAAVYCIASAPSTSTVVSI